MIHFESDHLLTADEVAQTMGVSPSTVRGWVREKTIPFLKLGPRKKGAVRHDPDALNQWIKEKANLLQVVS